MAAEKNSFFLTEIRTEITLAEILTSKASANTNTTGVSSYRLANWAKQMSLLIKSYAKLSDNSILGEASSFLKSHYSTIKNPEYSTEEHSSKLLQVTNFFSALHEFLTKDFLENLPQETDRVLRLSIQDKKERYLNNPFLNNILADVGFNRERVRG